MNSTTGVELIAMSDLPKYRVSRDSLDPRGWNIVDSNNVPVGVVADLIIDLQALTARYIVCSVSRGESRHVLIPTGFARLEEDAAMVHLDFITATDIEGLPNHTGLPLSDTAGAQIENALTGATEHSSGAAKIVRRTR